MESTRTENSVRAKSLNRARSDFEYFCKTRLKINPKINELRIHEDGTSALIPFVWNRAQRRVWARMQVLIAKGLPLKLVILKSRQVGMSTFFCAYLFWHMWRQGRYRAAIVAYEKKSTIASLNEMMATFYDGLPDEDKPKLRASGAKRIGLEGVYFEDRRSSCAFAVQTPKALRGVTYDGVLCTETAFYDSADEFFGGFLPAMSFGQSGLLVLESSPADGWFKDEYNKAKDGRNDRTAIFIPWWMCDDLYSRKVRRRGTWLYDEKTGTRITFPTWVREKRRKIDALALKESHPAVTDEQMWWWWHLCQNDYDGDEEWMLQEYPDDDVTAFQRATRSAFREVVPIIEATVSESYSFPDLCAGTLNSTTYTNPELEQQVEFIPELRAGFIDQARNPGLIIFKRPVSGYTYTIGADVADGEGEDDEAGERAYSAAVVYCCNTREQVATWRGHIDPVDYGDVLVMLGYFYNTALLTVERNNMGRLTEYRVCAQLYYPVTFRRPDLDSASGRLTKEKMWRTDKGTKPLMIASLRIWVKNGLFAVRDPGLQEEMLNYTVTKGKFRPGRGFFADRIIAASLCVMSVEQTEFAHRNIVMGAAPQKNESLMQASGMALRVLHAKTPPAVDRTQLPEELNDMMRMGDVWDSMLDELGSMT